MAQVYHGWIVGADGDADGASADVEVAIKVRHPGVKEILALDLEALGMLVGTIEKWLPPLRYLAVSNAVAHFKDFIEPQSDLRIEATNLEAFGQNFEYATTGAGLHVRFPKVIRPYVHESVLVETFFHATSLADVLGQTHTQSLHESAECASTMDEHVRDGDAGCDISVPEVRQRVGKLCLDTFMQMLFRDNLIHGDMHPGNLMFRFPEDCHGDPELIVLDTGLAVRMTKQDRHNFIDVFHAIATDDCEGVGKMMLERSPGDRDGMRQPEVFVAGVSKLIASARGTGITLGNQRIGEIFAQLLQLACAHRVELETSFVSIAVSIMILEGVGRQLDPVTDVIMHSKPLLIEAVRQRLF